MRGTSVSDEDLVIRQWPFPVGEAADIVLENMDTPTKDAIALTLREDLIIFHTDIGMWIRNAFGM